MIHTILLDKELSKEQMEKFANSLFDFSIKQDRIDFIRSLSESVRISLENSLDITSSRPRVSEDFVIIGLDKKDKNNFYGTEFGTEITYTPKHYEEVFDSTLETSINFGTTGHFHPSNEIQTWKYFTIYKILNNWKVLEIIANNAINLMTVLKKFNEKYYDTISRGT